MVAHDREAGRRAFEAALAVSPSCALAYGFGSVVMATGGDAARGIEWGERALRLSPFDPMRFGMCFAIAVSHFQRGEHEQAAEWARQVFQANPNWSYAHVLRAATQARLGRRDAAREAASRVLELQPGFTIGGMVAAAGYHPSLAQPLSEALRVAGLPE
jgi:tetratricopeptide (TPR) repeat protein